MMTKNSNPFNLPEHSKERGRGLIYRVLLICASLIILPMLIHTFYSYKEEYKEALNNSLNEMEIVGRSSMVNFEEWLLCISQLINSLATQQVPFADYPKIASDAHLETLFRILKRSDQELVVVAAEHSQRVGRINLFFDQIADIPTGKRKVFAAFDPLTQTHQIMVAARVADKEILVVGKSAIRWIERFKKGFRGHFPYHLALVDVWKEVIATDLYLSPQEIELVTSDDLIKKRAQILKTKKPFISLKQPLPEANFFLYVDVSKAAIEKGILRKIILRSSLFTFLFLFGGGSVVWILVSRMGRPLQELHHAMISVGKGDLTARYHTMRLGFEINQVGGLFNKTVDQLVTHMQSAADERLKSESYRKELQIARKIQKNLFPKKIPAFPSIEIATRYIPAKEVSGDFYDLFPLQDRLMIVIADSSGKGVSSSLFSLSVRSLLRSTALEFSQLTEMVDATNKLFCLDTEESADFVTAWIGIYESSTRKFQYTSCGHFPALLRKAGGEILELTTPGMALGGSPATRAQKEEVQLETGDFLLLFTDGVVEAQNRQEKFFGKDRLLNSFRTKSVLSPKEFIDSLTQELGLFTEGVDQFDDITLVAIQIV